MNNVYGAKQFIQDYILKKNEQIEWLDTDDSDLLYGYIVKRTPRTYRRLAELWIGKKPSDQPSSPDKSLLDLKLSIHKAKPISVDDGLLRYWLVEGWMIRKVTLSDDERTPLTEGYYMGPTLYAYIEREKQQKIKQEITTFVQLQEQLSHCVIPDHISASFSQHINDILSLNYEEFEKSDRFQDWTVHKKIVFLQFLIALLKLRETKPSFDFKEIGASYFKKIGGSKVFDRYREDFLNLLETWLQATPAVIGMISHGRIHSVYFSGNVKGRYANFQAGALHAVTDVALLNEQFHTVDHVLWLVENRAMLTRMAASPTFLKETASIVICLDGHIRSSHHTFTQQISHSPSIKQVLIWTDYDESGLSIAYDAYRIVPDDVTVKWIASDGSIFRDYEAYKNWLQHQLSITKREQEEVLGDEKQWKKWINH